MKKIYILTALFSAFSLFAQQKVAEQIQQLTAEGKSFKNTAPLSVITPQDNKAAVVRNATFAVIDEQLLKSIVTEAPETFSLSIPYNNRVVTVQLYKVDIFAPGFHIDTDKQANIAFTKGIHYRGIVERDMTSVASFNFFESEMNGIISSGEYGNLVVAKQLREDSGTYIIYSDANLAIPNTFACHTQDPEDVAPQRQSDSEQSIQSTRCVTMYFEIDYDLYQQNGSSTQQTGVWMTSVYNNVQTLFNNDNITTALRSFYIWTTQDPYTGDSSGDYLSQFGTLRPVFDGDLGQLLGIDPGGLGGVAVTIAGICSDNNFSYSDVFFDYANVPAFSWTVQVITHEFGHLLGSPHTHGCYWNGNNTAIDGCGSSQGYIEGNCAQGPIPTSSVKGTIMSYCHLVPNVGINFSNGFGPQPKQRILNHVEGSTCLSTDCINTCINTVNDFAITSVSTTEATITWTTINNSPGPWQAVRTAVSAPTIGWQTANTNSFTTTGLTPNTYYRLSVRPLCAFGQNPEIRNFIFATNPVDVCSGVQFTDTGGTSANYGNNQYLLRTYSPTTPGTKVRVEFQSFNTEADYDFLYVYNGPTATAENLINTYSGTNSPGTIESTAPDGSLTFKFISDVFSVAAGWNATVSCASLGTDDVTFANFSYYPNPSSGVVNIKSSETFTTVSVYNVTGQLLTKKTVNASEAAMDISSYANGVYFFRVANDNKQANFRIVKQ
ncbi:M12 family metallo-peptidase [Flavobacterium sp. J372]|uniref:M12 family metallo-peptidase n=1 Tax=Flavobacterium sp. J372 TaxID=2898436 RepID=UPI002150A574|nr:M12 family metallo-peptidase [Flavobacterium sp. J372]MCR5861234.1 M12 family metallo-peptidase [Flavobacterium sp. J372]